nr:MAG TPA: hypothetical protein [Inoviridae sp.]
MSETIRKIAVLAAVAIAITAALAAIQAIFPDSIFSDFGSRVAGVVQYLSSYIKTGREMVNLFFFRPEDVTTALVVLLAGKPFIWGARWAMKAVGYIRGV